MSGAGPILGSEFALMLQCQNEYSGSTTGAKSEFAGNLGKPKFGPVLQKIHHPAQIQLWFEEGGELLIISFPAIRKNLRRACGVVESQV